MGEEKTTKGLTAQSTLLYKGNHVEPETLLTSVFLSTRIRCPNQRTRRTYNRMDRIAVRLKHPERIGRIESTLAQLVKALPAIALLRDQVLIRLLHPERIHHGLWVPDNAKRSAGELWRGEVIACGPGARTPKKGILVHCDVKPGDIVGFYWRAAKVDVTSWPTPEHRIISESDIQYKEEKA